MWLRIRRLRRALTSLGTGTLNHLFQAELFLDGLDRTFLEFVIVHRQNGLLPVQIDLQVGAFAGFENRSLLREPTPELFARHVI
jgi:hypothetical protein